MVSNEGMCVPHCHLLRSAEPRPGGIIGGSEAPSSTSIQTPITQTNSNSGTLAYKPPLCFVSLVVKYHPSHGTLCWQQKKQNRKHPRPGAPGYQPHTANIVDAPSGASFFPDSAKPVLEAERHSRCIGKKAVKSCLSTEDVWPG